MPRRYQKVQKPLPESRWMLERGMGWREVWKGRETGGATPRFSAFPTRLSRLRVDLGDGGQEQPAAVLEELLPGQADGGLDILLPQLGGMYHAGQGRPEQ